MKKYHSCYCFESNCFMIWSSYWWAVCTVSPLKSAVQRVTPPTWHHILDWGVDNLGIIWQNIGCFPKKLNIHPQRIICSQFPGLVSCQRGGEGTPPLVRLEPRNWNLPIDAKVPPMFYLTLPHITWFSLLFYRPYDRAETPTSIFLSKIHFFDILQQFFHLQSPMLLLLI